MFLNNIREPEKEKRIFSRSREIKIFRMRRFSGLGYEEIFPIMIRGDISKKKNLEGAGRRC